jgi:hypothetical protein
MTLLSAFITGAITMGFAVAALLFARYWRRTRDGLFAAFAVAFVLLALHHGIVGVFHIPREERTWLFLLRLAAFALIIWAVLRKNLARR